MGFAIRGRGGQVIEDEEEGNRRLNSDRRRRIKGWRTKSNKCRRRGQKEREGKAGITTCTRGGR